MVLRLITSAIALSCALCLTLGLTACQPSDKKVKSVKDRLEAGELVEFTKPGYRRPSCTERQADWVDIRLTTDDERGRIVVRNQNSALNPGKHSCFRVGSVITLNSPSKRSDWGLARITKLSLVKLDKLSPNHLKGAFFASSTDFNSYKSVYAAKLGDRDEGIVTIVDLQYIKGSAPDENALEEQSKQDKNSDGYSETTIDGQDISGCTGAPWTEILVSEAFQQPILTGALKSYYRVGDLNCLKQGATVEVKAKRGDPAVGLVKVLKIKKFRLSHLAPSYFNLGSFNYAVLESAIRADIRGNVEWITVMDVQSLTAVGEVPGEEFPNE